MPISLEYNRVMTKAKHLNYPGIVPSNSHSVAVNRCLLTLGETSDLELGKVKVASL